MRKHRVALAQAAAAVSDFEQTAGGHRLRQLRRIRRRRGRVIARINPESAGQGAGAHVVCSVCAA